MLLESKNIRLRAVEPEDLEFFYKWENSTSMWHIANTLAPYSRYELKRYIAASNSLYESKQQRFMIDFKPEGKTIGTIDLYDFDPHNNRAAVGVFVEESFQKRGLAKESLLLLNDYALQFLGIHQLYAYIPKSNQRSFRLFQRCGFRTKGTLTDWNKTDFGYEDVRIVSLVSGLSDNLTT
jgi:diamine N-acetyltransferase